MNTKVLLTTSALAMGIAGIAGSFLPAELLRALDVASDGALPVFVQLLAALLFAFAMVNWTARGSLIGGIYNRPVAIGNLTHFVVGALALVKAALSAGPHRSILTIAAAIYVLFAIAFTMVFVRSPVVR
ncbi:MAG: hypothetical protein ACXW31_11325 [Thermoanaerobaculia bacterium]